eukprot:TRINITY_DN40826_c0_g1_i1.p1 TRINITY_DN40826_c0_g1~~TRINITY_DN40826_c0_g1_i1.p1  ORF type:complete len:528 (+),score=88.32 TRINITY_DN40826_c0_g1_i1:198-1781(+)
MARIASTCRRANTPVCTRASSGNPAFFSCVHWYKGTRTMCIGDDEGPRVAVIGTGIAALMCVRSLAQKASKNASLKNMRVTLCTSRGKLATQMGPRNQSIPQPGKPFFDYGCQYFTADDAWFAQEVSRWEKLGLVQALPAGQVGTLSAKEGFCSVRGTKCWVGCGGMGPMLSALIEDTVKEFRGIVEHVSGFPDAAMAVKGLQKDADGWQLITQSKSRLGPYDVVIGGFAQNVLTDPFLLTGGEACKEMLQCLRRVESNQLIPMQVSFHGDALPASFTAAHIYGEPCLGFVSNNSQKPQQSGKLGTSGPAHWTLLSTSEFAEREFNCNPKGYRNAAEKEMLSAFGRVLGVDDIWKHKPSVNRINHWEDGLAVNTPPQSRGCLFDSSQQFGWVGDFCVQPGIEGAALSGCAMATVLEAWFCSGRDKFDDGKLLPAECDWLSFSSSNIANGTLMDIGTFSSKLELRPLYTHTDLVPRAIGGYDPAAHTGAAGKAAGKAKGNKGKGSKTFDPGQGSKAKGKGKSKGKSKY